MEAAAPDGEGCGAPIWLATTNWIVAAGGSLGDAISFDASEEIENEEVEAKPILLLRPDGDDPPPCEITIGFRKKHEIHMVYVRSTARIYEIYYSSDQQDSNKEYLCTVHCGAAVKEMIPQATTGCQGNDNGTAARPDKVVRSDSSNSDEDGWVQVKAPDSFLQDDRKYSMSQKCQIGMDIGMDSPMMQVHYEATAEISDYSPCGSLTLRLLSIQTKACVHIEEIYVYADPVESSESDQPAIMGENMGGSSLLTMLVPSLMQLSKSGASRDRFLPDEARVSKDQYGTEKTVQTVSSGMGNTVLQEACSWKSPDQKGGADQEQTEVNLEKVQSDPIQEVTVPHQMSNSLDDQNANQAYSRLEKVLDKLVLKVERIEAFCSKFEENMLKPLCCMEQRLQQLEQKLDGLAIRSQSSEQSLCSRITSSESNEFDSKNKGDNTKHTESKENTSFLGTVSPIDEVEPSVPESPTRPGLVIKAPEFLNEDDDGSDTEETLDPLVEEFPKNKKPFSIDSALASSLAAFLTSTTSKSPNLIPSPIALPREFVNGNNSSLDSLAVVPSEGAGYLSDITFIEENDSDFLGAGRKETCFDDSSLLSRDAAIVNDELSSDLKNKNCGKSDGVTEGATFDDSLLVANADVSLPVFLSQADSGFIAIPPEFLYRHYSFNCDDTLESNGLDCFEAQSSTPSARQTVPPLAESLSSTIVQSPKMIPVLFNAPSGISSVDSNELSASTVAVPSEGAESVIVNQEENKVKDEVYPDAALRTVPLEASFEQEDHDAMGWKEWLSSEKTDGLLEQNLPKSTFFLLNAGVSQKCHGGSGADHNDAKEAVLHGFNQHGRGWIEDSSSTSSSLHENLITVENEWPVGGSSDSSRALPTTNHSKWQAATSNDENDPAFSFEEAFGQADCTTVTCEFSAACCEEKPNKELEDMICDVKFTSERNWITGLPLEFLLGEMPNANQVEPSSSGGDGNGDATGQQPHDSSSSKGIGWENDSDGNFLRNVPPCPPPESTM